jgi:superfamily II DNA/RNA helicase
MSNFPFLLDDFQLEANKFIQNNEDILVTAPTGLGKTIIAELAILKAIQTNKKIIYTSPIKALSNQKYREFAAKYGKIINVGLITGDIKINPKANLIVITTEILRNIIIHGSTSIDNDEIKNDILNNVDSIVLDEVHYINNPDRGHVWEEIILTLPIQFTLIMLSATIPESSKFVAKLEKIRGKKINLISVDKRIVPLTMYHFVKRTKNLSEKNEDRIVGKKMDLIKIMDSNNQFNDKNFIESQNMDFSVHKLSKYIEFLQNANMLPAIFFVFSQKKCEEYANEVLSSLTTDEEKKQIQMNFHDMILNRVLPEHSRRVQNIDEQSNINLNEQILNGIAYHHAGMSPLQKEINEFLFSKGLIKVMFVTETFAVGIHLPIKTVVFCGFTKFDGSIYRNLTKTEYIQMMGRAGRRGIDTMGYVINLPLMPHSDLTMVKTIMESSEDLIRSRLKLDCRFVLKFASNKFYNIFELVNKSMYGIEISEKIDDLQKKIIDTETELANLKNKKIHEYTSSIGTIIQNINNDNLNIFVDDMKNIIVKSKHLQKLNISLSDMHDDIIKKITLTLKFLAKNQYITFPKDVFKYNHSNLNQKGLIAMRINECNEILMTEVIIKKFLDDFPIKQIAVILSIFAASENPEKKNQTHTHQKYYDFNDYDNYSESDDYFDGSNSDYLDSDNSNSDNSNSDDLDSDNSDSDDSKSNNSKSDDLKSDDPGESVNSINTDELNDKLEDPGESVNSINTDELNDKLEDQHLRIYARGTNSTAPYSSFTGKSNSTHLVCRESQSRKGRLAKTPVKYIHKINKSTLTLDEKIDSILEKLDAELFTMSMIDPIFVNEIKSSHKNNFEKMYKDIIKLELMITLDKNKLAYNIPIIDNLIKEVNITLLCLEAKLPALPAALRTRFSDGYIETIDINKIIDDSIKSYKKQYANRKTINTKSPIINMKLEEKENLLYLMKLMETQLVREEVNLDNFLKSAMILQEKLKKESILPNDIDFSNSQNNLSKHISDFIVELRNKNPDICYKTKIQYDILINTISSIISKIMIKYRIKSINKNVVDDIYNKLIEIYDIGKFDFRINSDDQIEFWKKCHELIILSVKNLVTSEYFKKTIKMIKTINNKVNKNNPNGSYKWDSKHSMVTIFKLWINDGNIYEILDNHSHFNITIGYFIKHVLKINEICNELLSIYKHRHNQFMVEKIKNVKKLIMQDIIIYA